MPFAEQTIRLPSSSLWLVGLLSVNHLQLSCCLAPVAATCCRSAFGWLPSKERKKSFPHARRGPKGPLLAPPSKERKKARKASFARCSLSAKAESSLNLRGTFLKKKGSPTLIAAKAAISYPSKEARTFSLRLKSERKGNNIRSLCFAKLTLGVKGCKPSLTRT